MAIRSVALVNCCPTRLSMAHVSMVAASIQRQVIEHIYPTWGHTGSVIAASQDQTIPSAYYPIFLRDGRDSSNLPGVHYFTERGEIYANVDINFQPWSLIASHEALEMITDPTTDWKMTAPSLIPSQGLVEYLVEICDPCQHEVCGYRIDNILVSDFYVPAYFNPTSNGPLSMSRKVTRPLQILPGGYLSWRYLGDWFIGTADGSGRVNAKPYLGASDFAKLPGDSIREKMDFATATLPQVGVNVPLKGKFQSELTRQRRDAKREAQQLERFGQQRREEYQHHQTAVLARVENFKKAGVNEGGRPRKNRK